MAKLNEKDKINAGTKKTRRNIRGMKPKKEHVSRQGEWSVRKTRPKYIRKQKNKKGRESGVNYDSIPEENERKEVVYPFYFRVRMRCEHCKVTQERRLSTTASRTMAAMSLGFIVLVTPWTIQEVVAACTGQRAPAPLDFMATWLALSNSFWNPFLYWLLNNHFRRISRELLFSRFRCRKSINQKEQHFQNFQHQPHCCNNTNINAVFNHNPGCDFEGLSEKYWGEILERTLSSTSLHALQRAYSHPRMDSCNGLQEMRVFDTAVPDL
ncbi:hypothetical protein JTB14_017073 [Gonioctena quinquepunctata]|nr:hypothetical protein JTB14_017073 [Gonioctena quinquepunctata]